jgi:general secretion pathway protein K
MKKPREEGAALLAVLLLVAAMSALAVGAMDDIRFGIRREENAEAIGQAQWYALGAETMARQRLALASQTSSARMRELAGRWLSYPVENGTIRARMASATECFNLNSVVQGASEQWVRSEEGVAQFVGLMKAIGIAENTALSLAEALADWIDTDSTRNTQGAEDDTYMSARMPYRTAGTLLSETSELRAIRGFGPEIYARLRPFVCALPVAALSPMNINMLDPAKPELIAMLMTGNDGKEAARRALLARPPNGWRTVDEFWNQPALRAHLPGDAALGQLSLASRYYTLEAVADYSGSEAILTSLFEQSGPGTIRLVARRWTIEE